MVRRERGEEKQKVKVPSSIKLRYGNGESKEELGAKEEEKERGKGWQSTENACQKFEAPSLKQEIPGSGSVERLSAEKVQPIEASKLEK